MKLRYLVLATVVAATLSACSDSPTASKTGRAPAHGYLTETDTTSRGTGAAGSGH